MSPASKTKEPGDPIRILMVEDSEDDAELLMRHLRQGGFEPSHHRVQTGPDLRAALAQDGWDLIVSDYSMPTFDGVSAYAMVREVGKDIPFIYVSGNMGEDTAVEAMRQGVSDYFVKGNLKRLVPAIRRELREKEDRRRRRAAEAELQRAEERLRQGQKMEAIGRLAGGVAHDFNNLLTVIFGHVDLMLEGPRLSKDSSESLGEIRNCADRAATLTRQLLAFSRMQVLQRQPLSLNRLVTNVAKMLRRLIGEDVELATSLDPGLWLVMADPGQIDQVLMNLAINARDAMPRGGKLSLRTSNAVLDAAAAAALPGLLPGDYVMLEVEDNGVGMDAETLSHIFEPFFTTKEEGKGTGLGLAMVYGIVNQSGGQLYVDSAPGRGTRFRIYLGRCQAVEERADGLPGTAPPAQRQGSETVLLAEDEVQLRQLLVMALRSKGYTVLSAEDGAAALALSRSHKGPIQLLLTDITMPVMDGRELARHLLEERPGTKVMLMTGYARPQMMDELEGGKMDWLQKPFSVELLLERMRKALDSGMTGQG